MERERVQLMIAEVQGSPLIFRLLLAIVMALAAFGLLGGAWGLVQLHHWVAWSIAFFVLEPLGLASAAATVFLIAPDSFVADVFAFLFSRAKVAIVLVATAMSVGIATLVVMTAIELLRG